MFEPSLTPVPKAGQRTIFTGANWMFAACLRFKPQKSTAKKRFQKSNSVQILIDAVWRLSSLQVNLALLIYKPFNEQLVYVRLKELLSFLRSLHTYAQYLWWTSVT
uniref:Uncharacterized protein n=1 Tax=Schistocephalus solidus TaxID=70667 RepID=A0A0X3NU23_SCHSO